MILAARLSVPCGEVRSRVVSTLVVVVLDVEVDQLAEVYPQGAAGVVDVLSIQRLKGDQGETSQKLLPLEHTGRYRAGHIIFRRLWDVSTHKTQYSAISSKFMIIFSSADEGMNINNIGKYQY